MALTWDVFQRTNDAYRSLIRQPAGQLILADLAVFCKANAATMVKGDPHMTSFNEGKRAVWNRIQAVLHLTDDEIYAILGGVTLQRGEDASS